MRCKPYILGKQRHNTRVRHVPLGAPQHVRLVYAVKIVVYVAFQHPTFSAVAAIILTHEKLQPGESVTCPAALNA